jgi:hypothetical protein
MPTAYGKALSQNRQMLKLARKFSFRVSRNSGDLAYEMTLNLKKIKPKK